MEEKIKAKAISNSSPLFSVLMANYNNGKYLMDAIDSVRKQTYTNWEIILVDDCSTDNSKELYGELEKDKRIHIYYNDSNHGCGYTKHRCVELANGEICGFLDPDDAITEDALKIMVMAHQKSPLVSLINSDLYITDAELNIVAKSVDTCDIPQGETFLSCQNGIAPFATFKFDYYKRTQGINSDMRRAVDHDLYYRLEEVGKVQYIGKPLYLYRHDTGRNISLGDDNPTKAYYWDLYAMINACIRRNISVEKNVFPLIDALMKDAYYKGQKQTYSSSTYQLGMIMLKPFKIIRKFFRQK